MQQILAHIESIARPAPRKYLAAETALTLAHESKDQDALKFARQDVILAARLAIDVLHHLADYALKEPLSTLKFGNVSDVRTAVDGNCKFLRTTDPIDDVALLRDIAMLSSTTNLTGRTHGC